MEKNLIFINLSNHPSSSWTEAQKLEAAGYGEIRDWPFPVIPPEIDSDAVEAMAESYLQKILELSGTAVVTIHLMGELTFCYKLINLLQENKVKVVASTTKRNVAEFENGVKQSSFIFQRFREY